MANSKFFRILKFLTIHIVFWGVFLAFIVLLNKNRLFPKSYTLSEYFDANVRKPKIFRLLANLDFNNYYRNYYTDEIASRNGRTITRKNYDVYIPVEGTKKMYILFSTNYKDFDKEFSKVEALYEKGKLLVKNKALKDSDIAEKFRGAIVLPVRFIGGVWFTLGLILIFFLLDIFVTIKFYITEKNPSE
jgi:hypothetical protein